MRTIDQVISMISQYRGHELLQKPEYRGTSSEGSKLGLFVPSMETHTTDEGYQLFLGLRDGGDYNLMGYGHPICGFETDVAGAISRINPTTVVLQDKREWEGRTGGPGFHTREQFQGVASLKNRNDIFKLTVLKDAQNNASYHRYSAYEIDCHAWIVYYHPRIVKHVAPYVRREHLIHTYHTVDPDIVPPYTASPREDKAILSGAVSGAYPLRTRLAKVKCRHWDYHKHPGYGRTKCHTPEYLQLLSRYKVAICTSSRYGYALRKLIEATAAGCRVITDLPVDDQLPVIDGNLFRVSPAITNHAMTQVIDDLVARYDAGLQQHYAEMTRLCYDYKVMGAKLAADIESLRLNYNAKEGK